MTFGILTLATPDDYRKAIGLALSLRVSNPGVPTAVACSPRLHPVLKPYFDHLVAEDPSLRGFVHKVHLDRYSPFQDTFFFDSDVLVFRDLSVKVEEWGDQAYNATGIYMTDGKGTFGLDRRRVMEKVGRERLVEIGGAGHAYFRKPDCVPVFDLAREVAADYRSYAGDIPLADEDVMNIVMTLLDIRPRDRWEFLSRHFSAVPGTLSMDATRGHCRMIERGTGKPMEPYMMHFAADEAAFAYARQLRRLFTKYGADATGLYRTAIADFWKREVRLRASNHVKRMLRALRTRTT